MYVGTGEGHFLLQGGAPHRTVWEGGGGGGGGREHFFPGDVISASV